MGSVGMGVDGRIIVLEFDPHPQYGFDVTDHTHCGVEVATLYGRYQ
jgi:hypothetical protein